MRHRGGVEHAADARVQVRRVVAAERLVEIDLALEVEVADRVLPDRVLDVGHREHEAAERTDRTDRSARDGDVEVDPQDHNKKSSVGRA